MKVWLRAILLVGLFNLIFAALLFTTARTSRTSMVEKIRQGFTSGDLSDIDYLQFNTRQGWHQYNDCAILQMISNPDASLAARALGPKFFLSESSAHSMCYILRERALSGNELPQFVEQRYTRYWHGYIPVVVALLTLSDISTARITLRAGVYLSILALFLAGIKERGFAPLTSSIAVAGGLFWGVMYFGQGMSHGPGDTAIMFGIAGIVYWHRYLSSRQRLLAYCAVFGAVIVYFEMLTGQLPTAAGLLFTTVYILSRVDNREQSSGNHMRTAVEGLLAFTIGAALTVVARVLTAALFVKPDGLDHFFFNLEFYTRPASTGLLAPELLQPFIVLLSRGEVLAYGSRWGMMLLYLSAMMTWATALVIAHKQGNRLAWTDLAAFTIGASSVFFWILILQTHTLMHAGFMARMLIAPIALCWAACLWQLRQWKGKSIDRHIANNKENDRKDRFRTLSPEN